MLTQEGRASLSDIADLNRLKLELNQLQPVDIGDYVADLPPEQPCDRLSAY